MKHVCETLNMLSETTSFGHLRYWKKKKGLAFAKIVENRKKETLMQDIKSNIAVGFIIYSDE